MDSDDHIAGDDHPDAGAGPIALIDSGARIHSKRVLDHLGVLGYGPYSVRRLIATHFHLDHIGGMSGLQAVTNLPVESHLVEAHRLKQQHKGDVPNPVQQWWLKALLWPVITALHPLPITDVVPLEDGDKLPLLSGAEVIHTPGHTPGSISIYFPNEGVLIAADAMQRKGNAVTIPSPFFSSDMETAKESIRKLAELDFEILCLSHFLPMRKGARSAVRSLAEYIS